MADIKSIADQLVNLTVKDVSELANILKDEYGIEPAAATVVSTAAAGGGDAPAADDKSEFDLHLTGVGDNKVNVIKAVREITGLGLKEAKDIVDAAPKVVKEALPKDAADEAMKKLTEAGATGELK